MYWIFCLEQPMYQYPRRSLERLSGYMYCGCHWHADILQARGYDNELTVHVLIFLDTPGASA